MGNSLVFQWLRFWAPSTEGQRRRWHPTPVLLPGKSHGRRSLVGCSPWGRTESDTSEWLHSHFSLLCIGEANGNPLQCSCLENPRDRGAWWAAVYGVAQNWTLLKQLNSSSSSSTEGLGSIPSQGPHMLQTGVHRLQVKLGAAKLKKKKSNWLYLIIHESVSLLSSQKERGSKELYKVEDV